MSKSFKIKIVCGEMNHSSLIRVWEHLSEKFLVEILAFSSNSVHTNLYNTFLQTIEFPIIQEMPGFMRDLDKYLVGASVIVGFETSKLYTFQALRAARKLGVPFVCISHDYSPFIYDKFQNIRAIQHDIFHNSNIFLSTSRKSEQLLLMEGVTKDRIARISATIDSDAFSFSIDGARKFRNYINIPEHSILLTIIASQNDLEPCSTIFQGIRLAIGQLDEQQTSQVRILVCGSGAKASELKYQIADLGLGSRTMFLSQDLAPFLSDLLSATDLMVEGKNSNSQCASELPWHLLSALTSGVQLIVPKGSIGDDITAGMMVSLMEDFSSMDVACHVTKAIVSFERNSKSRFARGELAKVSLSPSVGASQIGYILESQCVRDEHLTRNVELKNFVASYQVPVTFKDARNVLIHCEEVRDFSFVSDRILYSEILRIKGDALCALARGEEAVSAFEDSLKASSTNFRAFRGLGYLAWHGHSNDDALSFFKRGLALNPNDYHCLVGIGLVYRRLKMFTESAFWLLKAIAVEGPDAHAVSLLVQACLENSDLPEAFDVLNAARDTIGDVPNVLMAIDNIKSQQ